MFTPRLQVLVASRHIRTESRSFVRYVNEDKRDLFSDTEQGEQTMGPRMPYLAMRRDAIGYRLLESEILVTAQNAVPR